VRAGIAVLEIAFLVALALWPSANTLRARTLIRLWTRLPNPAPHLIRF
jgi:hypothetical protein